jgi:hypothetical protein
MAALPSLRVSRLSKIPWRSAKGLMVLALLGGTMLAQAVSTAPGPPNPTSVSPALVNPDPVFGSDGLGSDGLSPVDPGAAALRVQARSLPEAPSHHRFWDKENRFLFAAVAALSIADFAVTRANLQSGGKELDPVTRLFSGSTAGLAVNFAGETAGIIGLSYYFHKTGHHKLERITPLLNIGASSFAVAYDFSHR